MATQGPKPSSLFDSETDEAPSFFAEINITPLTDVILVLLIICMVTSSAMVEDARQGRLDLTLPSASNAAPASEEANELLIAIAADGRLVIQDRILSDEELKEMLQNTHDKSPKTALLVQADGSIQHKRVVQVIDMMRAAGFSNVGIETQGP